MVQKHIHKCFEAINALDFRDEIYVGGMISPQGESVKLQKEINVTEGDNNG